MPFLNFLDIVYWGYFFVGILGQSRLCYIFSLTLGPTQVPIDPFIYKSVSFLSQKLFFIPGVRAEGEWRILEI